MSDNCKRCGCAVLKRDLDGDLVCLVCGHIDVIVPDFIIQEAALGYLNGHAGTRRRRRSPSKNGLKI